MTLITSGISPHHPQSQSERSNPPATPLVHLRSEKNIDFFVRRARHVVKKTFGKGFSGLNFDSARSFGYILIEVNQVFGQRPKHTLNEGPYTEKILIDRWSLSPPDQ
jgi:hypothetical protein